MAFSIRLYSSISEKNRLEKNDYLTRIMELNGVLKAPTSISNPSVIIETPNGVADLNKVNYAYCFQFHRWYFVVDTISISNKLTQLNLKVDVLMSFRTNLLLNTGMVARNEFDYDAFIVDNQFPMKNTETIEEDEVVQGSKINTTFNIASSSVATDYNMLMSVAINPDAIADVFQNDGMIEPPAGTNLPYINPDKVLVKRACAYYVCNQDDISEFQKFVYGNESRMNLVKSIVYFPFAIPHSAQKHMGWIGSSPFSSATGQNIREYYWAKNCLSDYMITENFILPQIRSYKDLPPYAQYQLFIPFCQWVDLDMNLVGGHEMIIYYCCDWGSGDATAYLYDVTAQRIIFSAGCQLGVKIGLTATNENAVKNGMTLGGIKLGMSVLTDAATMMTQIASEKYDKAAGTLLNSPMKAMNAYLSSIPEKKVKMEVGGGNGAYYSFLRAKLRITRKNPTITGTSPLNQYAHQYGLPLMQPRLLSNLHGFTTFDDIHLEHLENAFSNEIDELYNLLRSGVIFPNNTN